MVALRKLGGAYLAAVSLYTVAVILSHQQVMMRQADRTVWDIKGTWERAAQQQNETPPGVELALPPNPQIAAGQPAPGPYFPEQMKRPPWQLPALRSKLSGYQKMEEAEHRLLAHLSPELFANFELFLYVSKAQSGPIAQRMYVFRKDARGNLALLHDWPVSTGRERLEYNGAGERLSTTTPAGYYELDRDRFFVQHRSSEWGEQMPYAMFFNWIRNGRVTGLAIHGAVETGIGELGRRASAGCVRLSPEAAQTLFTLIRKQYRGLAPRFGFDHTTGTMSNSGVLLHDAAGNVERSDGYKVLVVIENYGGRNVVTAMF